MKRKYLYYLCSAILITLCCGWLIDTSPSTPCSSVTCESHAFCQSLNCQKSCQNGTIDEGKSCMENAYQCTKVSYSTKNINGQTYFLSNEKMNWWNAVRFCEALPDRKKLADLTTLNCNATLGSEGCSTSEIRKAFAANGWTEWIWTATPYGIKSNHSCWVHLISLSDGTVSYAYRNNSYYALCE